MNVDRYNELQKMSIDELKSILKANVKKSNNRLTRLEKNSIGTNANAYRWTEKKVPKEDALYYSKNRPRYSSKTKGLSKNELLHRISLTENFLEAGTSTITGINKSYKQSYETFKEKYSIENITYKDYVDIFESDNLEHFKKNYYTVFAKMFESVPDKNNMDGIKRIIENSFGKTLKEIDEQYNNEYGKSLIFDD